MKSIRSKLILWLALLLLVTNGLGFINALWTAKEYYQAVHDASLAQRARVMLQLLNETRADRLDEVVRQAASRFEQLDLTYRQGWMLGDGGELRGSDRVRYQLWGGGRCVSANGHPCTQGGIFSNLSAGFAKQHYLGETWHTYTVYSLRHELYLTVGYPDALGRDVLQRAMWASWGAQMLLLTPLSILLCSLVVGLSIAPLRRLGRQVANWPAQPLPENDVLPLELKAFVAALARSRCAVAAAEARRRTMVAALSNRVTSRLQATAEHLQRHPEDLDGTLKLLSRSERAVRNGHLLSELDRPWRAKESRCNLYRETALSCARHYDDAVSRGIRLTLRGAQREGEVAVPAMMIQGLLDNLIDNAINASPHGAEVIVTVRQGEGERLLLTVADAGPGLDEKWLHPEYAVDGPGSAGGLGLVLVREVAATFNLSLSLGRSQLLGGTLLRCRFPTVAGD
ncbi:sensor histidine kinase [Ferrimonas sediminicola]|uniref:histidine kinase n=1 Tax=Ferrimonas sediminicola TaxID=2569538 RepID=A0A4V5NV79_9GAMM|nr:sensor histidine kinase [Ferrimonas sediminicola]TKB49384.1 sensor histidine kinase [Ferrimonas sediminicola]